MKFPHLWWEDTASSHLTCHPLSYLDLFQQGCYSASCFPACTDHVIGPHQKQNFTLLVGLHGTSVGPKGPTGLRIYHVVCQSLLLTFHPLEIRGGCILSYLPLVTSHQILSLSLYLWAWWSMQHSNPVFPSCRTHFLSFQSRMLWDSVKSFTNPFSALLPLLIHITFCNEIADCQIKLAENELPFVNACTLILITSLAFTCSETDWEVMSQRLSLRCLACNFPDPLSDLKDAHSIGFFFSPQLPVTCLYKNGLSQVMDTCLTIIASSFITS